MIDGRDPSDLEPGERATHVLLAAVPPLALPLGFRDEVMRQISARGSAWEWIVAGVLGIPAVAFLVFQIADRGEEFATALTNVVAAASSDAVETFFFVDGTTVLAIAILGLASLIAAHAAIASPSRDGGQAR